MRVHTTSQPLPIIDREVPGKWLGNTWAIAKNLYGKWHLNQNKVSSSTLFRHPQKSQARTANKKVEQRIRIAKERDKAMATKNEYGETVEVKTLLDISITSDGIPGWNIKLRRQTVDGQTEYILLLNSLYYTDETFADDNEAIDSVMKRIAAIAPFAIKHASDYQEMDIMNIQYQDDARQITDIEAEGIGIVITMIRHSSNIPVGGMANILKKECLLTPSNLHKTLSMLFGHVPDVDDLNALREWSEQGPF